MEENLIPEEQITSDVDKTAGKNIAELSEMFQSLKSADDSMERSKEAESIKSAFYRILNKLKEEAAQAGEDAQQKLGEVEEGFKSLYAEYKQQRSEYNRQQDEIKAGNLSKKQAVIEDLKKLVESQEEVNFDAFREIQDRWREIGPVPASNFRDINDTYHLYVEKFYDIVKINRDLRDLDFKKNLEAKEAFCEAAEKLAENENVVAAFAELQNLHEQWKEFGPVAKEFRDDIWNRFKAATAVVNRKYQAHFEELKGQMEENLAAKQALCEKVEEIAAREVNGSGQWNSFSKEIEELQAEWRKIGFATKKENQKIYERFRAACDAFYARKRDFYNGVKEELSGNIAKKMSIIERAEALKDSTEWKKTTEAIIALQKEWKESGSVPHKKGEQLWKRFRAACDSFFEQRDKNGRPENDFYGNLRLKKQIIEEINAWENDGNETAAADKMRSFSERWNAIGHVPFKEKDSILAAYKEAMQTKFPLFNTAAAPRRNSDRQKALSPRDEMVRRYNTLQQDIVTYENNICFFSNSKNSAALVAQIQERIDAAKKELGELEQKIRKADEEVAE